MTPTNRDTAFVLCPRCLAPVVAGDERCPRCRQPLDARTRRIARHGAAGDWLERDTLWRRLHAGLRLIDLGVLVLLLAFPVVIVTLAFPDALLVLLGLLGAGALLHALGGALTFAVPLPAVRRQMAFAALLGAVGVGAIVASNVLGDEWIDIAETGGSLVTLLAAGVYIAALAQLVDQLGHRDLAASARRQLLRIPLVAAALVALYAAATAQILAAGLLSVAGAAAVGLGVMRSRSRNARIAMSVLALPVAGVVAFVALGSPVDVAILTRAAVIAAAGVGALLVLAWYQTFLRAVAKTARVVRERRARLAEPAQRTLASLDARESDTDVVLAVRGLHKAYEQRQVLRGVDLDVRRGEAIAILGPNGCGKSTLLRCLTLLEPYEYGRVLMHGQQVSAGRPFGGEPAGAEREAARRLRERVGMVFQKFHLFPHLTVLQNVACGPINVKGEPRERAEATALAMLERVGMAHAARRDPMTLSGGQQQRVAIARSLAMNPEVMLFDEPTSALDPVATREVLGVIRTLAEEGTTMLVVTHHLGFCRDVADRVVFLNLGRVEAIGTAEDVFDGRPTPAIDEFLRAGYV